MASRYGMEYGGSTNGKIDGGYGTPSASTPVSEVPAERKGFDEQTIIPVTIKMIQDKQTPSCTLRDGRDPHQVKVVGAIREKNTGSTNITYSIEDGTGLMDMKEWVDAENDNTATLEFRDRVEKEGRYIRIIGKIIDYEGKKEIVAYSVRPLNNANELTHHFLEVVYSAEKYKKKQQIAGAPNSYKSVYGNTGYEPSLSNNFMQNRTPLKQMSGMGIFSGSSQRVSSSSLYDLILQYIKKDTCTDGAGTDILPFISEHAKQFSESEIRDVISKISSEGLIYPTIDDNNKHTI